MDARGQQSELARRAREGDREAYADLVRRHRERLLAVAFARCGHREDALDAVQDAVLRGIEHVGQLRDASAFLPWMEALVVSSCSRMRERAYRSRECPLDAAEPAASDPSPVDRLWVEGLLAALPDRHRTVLRGLYLDGRTVAELAGTLGRPVGTVKRWLSEGRHELGTRMREEMEPMAEQATEARAIVVAGDDLTEAERAGIDWAVAESGLTTVHVYDQRGALAAVEEHRPPILVLGAHTDGPCDALAVVVRLNHATTPHRPPVIYLGPGDDWSVFSAWAAGVECYLTRPVDRAELARFLRLILANRKSD